MKALVVRLSAIGDVVHTLPVLAALRKHGWEAGWVVEPAARELLLGHSLLSRLVAAPAARGFGIGAARNAVGVTRTERYDVALDFQGLWKSAAWARLSGARRVAGYAGRWRREPLSALLLRETMDLPPDRPHVIDKNLALLRLIGIDEVGSREFPLPSSEAQSQVVTRELAGLGLGDFAVLNPGGGWASKRWPAERYGGVAQGLRERGLSALVTWGPGEEELADRVVAASGGAATRCFPLSLLHFAELARRARVVIGADTGPLHIACAVRAPVVGIYGPTDPARNGPFSAEDEVVRRAPACAPCHKRRCATHDGVMEAIPAAEVLRAVERRLERIAGTALAV